MKLRHAPAPSPFMTAREVAEVLGVSVTTVYKLSEQGSISAFKIGADYRFARDKIINFSTNGDVKRTGRRA